MRQSFAHSLGYCQKNIEKVLYFPLPLAFLFFRWFEKEHFRQFCCCFVRKNYWYNFNIISPISRGGPKRQITLKRPAPVITSENRQSALEMANTLRELCFESELVAWSNVHSNGFWLSHCLNKRLECFSLGCHYVTLLSSWHNEVIFPIAPLFSCRPPCCTEQLDSCNLRLVIRWFELWRTFSAWLMKSSFSRSPRFRPRIVVEQREIFFPIHETF